VKEYGESGGTSFHHLDFKQADSLSMHNIKIKLHMLGLIT
jgi:hypothetical protein